MKLMAITLCLGAAALTFGCMPATAPAPARPAVDTARIVDAIKTDEVHWNNDWKSGDAAKVAAHYAPTATLMVPGLAPMVGAPAIKAGIAGALEDKAFSLTFASDKVDVAKSGDLAATRGTFTQTATDPATKAPVTTRGTYVTVYKPQAGGAWKAVWDINTPGTPAPSAK
jgi:ketosteroid isomerase-like protein